MYSEEYDRLSGGKIKEEITSKLIEIHQNVIDSFNPEPENIKLFYAVMELEAWWLSMYGLFESRLLSNISLEKINNELGYRLNKISPEKYFYHPSNNLKDVYKLANKKYDKHKHEIESIVSKITIKDINNAVEDERCPSFLRFYSTLSQLRDQAWVLT